MDLVAAYSSDPSSSAKHVEMADDSFLSDEACHVEWARRDFIAQLPPELSLHILRQLESHVDVLTCARVSHTWREQALDDSVWRSLFERRRADAWALRPDSAQIWERSWRAAQVARRADRVKPPSKHAMQSITSRVPPDMTPGVFGCMYAPGAEQAWGVGERPKLTWPAIFAARYVLDRRWGLITHAKQAGEASSTEWRERPDPMDSSDDDDSEDAVPVPRRRVPRIGDPPHSHRRRSSGSSIFDDSGYKPFTTHLTSHDDSVYCVRADTRLWAPRSDALVLVTPKYDDNLPHPLGRANLAEVRPDVGLRGRIVSASRDHTLKVWDGESGLCLYTLIGHHGSVLCLEYDEEILVSGSSDSSVIVWDFRCDARYEGKPLADVFQTPEARRSVAGVCSSQAHRANAQKELEIRKRKAGLTGEELIAGHIVPWEPRPVARLAGHHLAVLDVTCDADWIVSCGRDTTIRVTSRKNLELAIVYREHVKPVNAASIGYETMYADSTSSGGAAKQRTVVVSVCGDSSIHLWDIETGQTLRTFVGHERGLACVDFQSRIIVSGSNDFAVRVWDAQTARCTAVCTAHSDLVRAISLDARRRIFASAGYDKRIMLWSIRDAFPLPFGEPVEETVEPVALNPSPLFAALQEPPSLTPLMQLDKVEARLFEVQMDTQRIISAGEEVRITVTDFVHREPIMRLFL